MSSMPSDIRDYMRKIPPIVAAPDPAPEPTIQERFDAFHATNPQVAQELERLAGMWFGQGHTKVAVKMLWEVLRWEMGITTGGDSGYRLNNNFTSRYARLLIARRPEWCDAFETRELRA